MEPVILIALNDSALRDAYGLLFAEQGYRVLTAAKVLECLHKVRWLAPEVLVLDEELWGGEDGLLAISGEDVVWPSVVILKSSGSNGRDEIQLPLVVASLERPVDFSNLLDEVTEARRIFLYTSGKAAQGSATQATVGVTTF